MSNEKNVIAKWSADMYDQHETGTEDVDFLLSVIGQAPKRILEVCCGSGRILVPLAKAGHNVSGFDADEYMLAKIPPKAEGLDNIQWRVSDAVYDDWGADFDIVVLAGNILYNIVSHMDYAKAQELFIQKAAAALKPGGHIYIDYQPGGHSLTQPNPSTDDRGKVVWKGWEGADSDGNFGLVMLLGGTYNADTQIDTFTRRYEFTLKSGEIIKKDISGQKHFATLKQINRWLRDAEFTIEQEHISSNTRGVIIYASKK